MIRASGIAAILGHVVQATGAQTGVLGQRFQDERQVGVDGAGSRRRAKGRQAGLGNNPGDAVAVKIELRGDGADGSAFGVVVTKYLCFSFGGEGHRFSGEVGFDEPRDAGNPVVPTPITVAGNGSSSRTAPWPALTVQAGVDQPRWVRGNRDASLSSRGPDNDVGARRGCDGRDDWFDSGCRRHVPRIGGLAGRTSSCSSGYRDHSGCKLVQRCGRLRTRSVFRKDPWAITADGLRTDTCAS